MFDWIKFICLVIAAIILLTCVFWSRNSTEGYYFIAGVLFAYFYSKTE